MRLPAVAGSYPAVRWMQITRPCAHRARPGGHRM